MFALLTQYLFHYKQVSIPGVGSFVLEQKPAELNFVEKIINPPSYQIRFSQDGQVDENLLQFIGNTSQVDAATAREKLEDFGSSLKRKIHEAPFTWKGIGQLEYRDSVVFHPKLYDDALTPVPAHRVIREHVQHTVWVGEQEVHAGTKEEVTDQSHTVRKKSVRLITGWILLALAAAFIVFFIWKHPDVLASTGSKFSVQPGVPAATYH